MSALNKKNDGNQEGGLFKVSYEVIEKMQTSVPEIITILTQYQEEIKLLAQCYLANDGNISIKEANYIMKNKSLPSHIKDKNKDLVSLLPPLNPIMILKTAEALKDKQLKLENIFKKEINMLNSKGALLTAVLIKSRVIINLCLKDPNLNPNVKRKIMEELLCILQ